MNAPRVAASESMDSLVRLAAQTGGCLHGAAADFKGVSTDTRSLKPGDLFVALSGPNFDGHEFVRRAGCLGAAGALVAHAVECNLPQVQVADVLKALQDYAAAWRQRHSLPVVGVTGSNGKTTVKQMLAAILAPAGPVLATRGNLNNHIGVPLTLLRLNRDHQAAVIEMGASGPGEIARLAALAAPDVGVVTLAGLAHTAGFDSVEGVARAKGELFAALPMDGVAVINADDHFASLWRSMSDHCRRLSFGLGAGADVRARSGSVQLDGGGCPAFDLVLPEGTVAVRVGLPGRHQVMNALAAAAAASACGADIEAIRAGLASVEAAPGRLSWRAGARGSAVLDDTYNANPGSLRVALELLATRAGERWLALGDMAELGRDAESAHRAAGRLAHELGVTRLFAFGPLSALAAAAFGTGGVHFTDCGALNRALSDALADAASPPGILVKGSRSMRMERVVQALCGPAGSGEG